MAPLTPMPARPSPPARYSVADWERRPLAPQAFEIRFARPGGFTFLPGQRIALTLEGITREYSLASPPGEKRLTLCIGLVAGGRLSPQLAAIEPGTPFTVEGPLGHFVLRPSSDPVVLVGGGTGVAPFRAMAAHGLRTAMLVQGAPNIREAYYQAWFRQRLERHVLCLSQDPSVPPGVGRVHAGRLTDYLARQLPSGCYDFYVSGGPRLVRDAVAVIDDRFPQSRVRTELFH